MHAKIMPGKDAKWSSEIRENHTVGKKNATEQKLGEVSSDLDLLRYDKAKNSSV